MFDTFSERARRVVFLARATAGRRGGTAIEVDDLAKALVLEDQNSFDKIFDTRDVPEGAVLIERIGRSRSFLSANVAAELLARIEPLLDRSEPIGDTVEMQVAPDLKRVFDNAAGMRLDSHYPRVEPLHLLLAVIEDESSKSADAFTSAGVTIKSVRAAIDSGDYF